MLISNELDGTEQLSDGKQTFMRVRELMTRNVQTCTPETNLAAAAMIMWEQDCGAVPVVGHEGKVIGMVTDRDICMAVATKRVEASAITVGEVMSGQLYACSPDDDINEALAMAGTYQVRRLPVVDNFGGIEGVLSINDIILHADTVQDKRSTALSCQDALTALKAICAHRSAPAREEASMAEKK
jgi:CBS domain-containing protein